MTDVYRQASFEMKLNNEGEARWLRTYFGHFDTIFAAMNEAEVRSSHKQLELVGITEEFDDWGWDAHHSQGCVVIEGSVYPNVDAMAKVLQAFLREHKRDDVIIIEYADTCSAPRPGQFGGGFAAVSRDKAMFRHTGTLAAEVARKITPVPATIDPLCPTCGAGHRLQYVCRTYEYHDIAVLHGDGNVDLAALNDSTADEDYPDHFYCNQCGDTFNLDKTTHIFTRQK